MPTPENDYRCVNQIYAIKHEICRSLSRCKTSRNGQLGHIHSFAVDLPLSVHIFNSQFAKKITKIEKYSVSNVTCKVCIEDLNPIFGSR